MLEVHHRPITVDLQGVDAIDAWVERLATAGVRLVYSSGTSGNFSFVHRDEASWALLKLANTNYLAALFVYDKVGRRWQRKIHPGLGVSLLGPATFGAAGHEAEHGTLQRILPRFPWGAHRHAVYRRGAGVALPLPRLPLRLRRSPQSALRSATYGPRTPAEQALVQELLRVAAARREQNFAAFVDELQRSTAAHCPVFVFGVPFSSRNSARTWSKTPAK